MPARKRHRREPEHPDPVVRFGRALQDAKARERAEQNRIRAQREEEQRLERLAAERAARLAEAERQLADAIVAVKRARGGSAGDRQIADALYRSAKAHVVELETGQRPDWAPDATA